MKPTRKCRQHVNTFRIVFSYSAAARVNRQIIEALSMMDDPCASTLTGSISAIQALRWAQSSEHGRGNLSDASVEMVCINGLEYASTHCLVRINYRRGAGLDI